MIKCIYEKGEICTKFNADKQCEICNHYVPVCKSRKTGDSDYTCTKFNFRIGDVQKSTLTICNVCGCNNPANFKDLMDFFEDYTMKNLT